MATYSSPLSVMKVILAGISEDLNRVDFSETIPTILTDGSSGKGIASNFWKEKEPGSFAGSWRSA